MFKLLQPYDIITMVNGPLLERKNLKPAILGTTNGSKSSRELELLRMCGMGYYADTAAKKNVGVHSNPSEA